MTFVSELSPRTLWQHFDQILTIPRGSKKEQAARNYVISIADKNGLTCRLDETGNLVVRKPPAPGREKAPTLVLQAHLDMVNEKNSDVVHDFEKDPIRPQRDGDYLKASGTTLGADNGIGVAAQLAILESSDIDHGPLELLFTVDEETGLTGAAGLQSDFLQGRFLINLDTEEEGAIYVGCAGGAGVDLEMKLETENTSAGQMTQVLEISGLKGGHSGVDIHLQRGNAIKLLARALTACSVPFQIASLEGGNMRNAIPREASAVIVTAVDQAEDLSRELDQALAQIALEFKPAEPGFAWDVSPCDQARKVLTPGASSTLVDLLNGLPHGVLSWSYDIPDLVETSANLATVGSDDGKIAIHVSNRSSVQSALEATGQRVAAIGRLAGASISLSEAYPGWKPNMDSALLNLAQSVFDEQLGAPADVKAIHAGLECGLIGEKFLDMDMISIGPEIQFPHSPDERVDIESVAKFWDALVSILERV